MQIICSKCFTNNAPERGDCIKCQNPLILQANTRFWVDDEDVGMMELLSLVPKLRKRVIQLENQQRNGENIAQNEARKTDNVVEIEQKNEPILEEKLLTPQNESLYTEEVDNQAKEEVEIEAELAEKTEKARLYEEQMRLWREAEAETERRAEAERQKQAEEAQKLEQERQKQAQYQQEMERQVQNFSQNRYRIIALERELGEIEESIRKAARSGDTDTANRLRIKHENVQKNLTALKNPIEIPQPQTTTPPPIQNETPIYTQTPAEHRPQVSQNTQNRQKTATPRPPSALDAALSRFFAPLNAAMKFASDKYAEFKAQNKLPLFFLTLVGVVVLLFGMGFLVQYSANTWFGTLAAQAKASVGLAGSLVLLGIGAYLIRRNEIFRDFGAALVGLSVSINYLLIYYLSDTLSPSMGFGLIALNSLFSFGLAVYYRSPIIAVLSLVGGALSPMYLQETGSSKLIYFSYLWVLSLVAVAIAQHFRWLALSVVSFLLSAFILIGSIYTNVWQLPMSTHLWAVLLIFHAFAYLHLAAALVDKWKWREKHNIGSVGLWFSAEILLGFSLYGLFGGADSTYTGILAMAYLGNAVPAVLLFARSLSESDEAEASLVANDAENSEFRYKSFFESVQILVAASFVALSVPIYFSWATSGIFWSLEAMILLIMGLRFRLSLVQSIGFAGLILSAISFEPTFNQIAISWDTTLLTQGYFNLLWLGGLLSIMYAVVYYFRESLSKEQTFLLRLLPIFLAIWSSLLLFLTLGYHYGMYAWVVAPLPTLAYMYVGSRYKNDVLEVWGWLHFALMFYVIALSMSQVNSFRFPAQELHTKIIMIAFILLLALLQDFYKYLLPTTAKLTKAAFIAREVFFWVLPIALIDVSRHNVPDYLSVALWLVLILSLAVRELTQRVSMTFQVHALLALALAITILDVNYLSMVLGGLVLGGWLFVGRGYKEEQYLARTSDKVIFTLAYYYPFLMLIYAYIDYNYSRTSPTSLLPVFPIASLSLFFLLLAAPFAPALRQLKMLNYRFAWVLSGVGFLAWMANLGMTQREPNIMFIFMGLQLLAVAVFSYIVYSRHEIYAPMDKHKSIWQLELLALQLFYLLTYSLFIQHFTQNLTTPLLTVLLFLQAIALVFVALKPDYRVLVKFYILLFAAALLKLFFFDLEQADTLVKIIVFIGVGVLFLVSAFLFINYTSKAKEQEKI
jgi:uncharacterized membrane protein